MSKRESPDKDSTYGGTTSFGKLKDFWLSFHREQREELLGAGARRRPRANANSGRQRRQSQPTASPSSSTSSSRTRRLSSLPRVGDSSRKQPAPSPPPVFDRLYRTVSPQVRERMREAEFLHRRAGDEGGPPVEEPSIFPRTLRWGIRHESLVEEAQRRRRAEEAARKQLEKRKPPRNLPQIHLEEASGGGSQQQRPMSSPEDGGGGVQGGGRVGMRGAGLAVQRLGGLARGKGASPPPPGSSSLSSPVAGGAAGHSRPRSFSAITGTPHYLRRTGHVRRHSRASSALGGHSNHGSSSSSSSSYSSSYSSDSGESFTSDSASSSSSGEWKRPDYALLKGETADLPEVEFEKGKGHQRSLSRAELEQYVRHFQDSVSFLSGQMSEFESEVSFYKEQIKKTGDKYKDMDRMKREYQKKKALARRLREEIERLRGKINAMKVRQDGRWPVLPDRMVNSSTLWAFTDKDLRAMSSLDDEAVSSSDVRRQRHRFQPRVRTNLRPYRSCSPSPGGSRTPSPSLGAKRGLLPALHISGNASPTSSCSSGASVSSLLSPRDEEKEKEKKGKANTPLSVLVAESKKRLTKDFLDRTLGRVSTKYTQKMRSPIRQLAKRMYGKKWKREREELRRQVEAEVDMELAEKREQEEEARKQQEIADNIQALKDQMERAQREMRDQREQRMRERRERDEQERRELEAEKAQDPTVQRVMQEEKEKERLEKMDSFDRLFESVSTGTSWEKWDV